jgi:transposase, IS5 family
MSAARSPGTVHSSRCFLRSSCGAAGVRAATATAGSQNLQLARDVECIGEGKAHRPYEFGVKVSVATLLKHSKGGQFVTHVKAAPGNPYDGHTLATVIPEMEQQIGATLNRILADAGYRGHNAPPEYRFKLYTAG